MKTGVVIGRFQSSFVHAGYLDLISHVDNENDKLVLVVGGNEAIFTNKHPLPFETRKNMLSLHYGHADIIYMPDNPSDEVWDSELDKLLSTYDNVTLYGSRDSFIKTYKGVNKVEEFGSRLDVSATDIRRQISQKPHYLHNKLFREGMIYVTENRYPITYPTVDIAMLNQEKNMMILGKKHNNDKLCFPGGFVDRKDLSLEKAARREFTEEVQGVTIKALMYLSSHKVDDWRYRGCNDGIMTTLFLGIGVGTPIEGDDLEHAQWYGINGFDMNKLQKCHHMLFNSLKNYVR